VYPSPMKPPVTSPNPLAKMAGIPINSSPAKFVSTTGAFASANSKGGFKSPLQAKSEVFNFEMNLPRKLSSDIGMRKLSCRSLEDCENILEELGQVTC
jgi:hypothetical protein